MQRTIKFVGSIADQNVKESLPIVTHVHGQDTVVKWVNKNDVVIVNEVQFGKIKGLVEAGVVEVVKNYFDVDVVLAGLADVYDPAAVAPAPKDITATINHSIGNTLYEVDLMNDNYEVVNKTAASFQIKLKTGGVSAAADIGYAVVVEK